MYNCRSLHIGLRDASYGIRYGMHYGSCVTTTLASRRALMW